MTTQAAIKGRTRLINDTQREVQRLLVAAAEEIARILQRQPSDYQRWRLAILQKEIARILEETGASTGALIGQAQGNAWAAGVALADDAIQSPRLAALIPRLSTDQLQAMQHFTTEKMAEVSVTVKNKINSELATVVIGQQNPFDAVKSITGLLEETTYKRAGVIVRTELAIAFSNAQQGRLESWAERVPGIKKRWVKSGKMHPRLAHAVINGQVRDVDKPFDLEGGTVKMMHPHDPTAPAEQVINCGCVSVPEVPGYAIQAAEKEANL